MTWEKLENLTIEVSAKNKDDDFTFADLELFHQACQGGKFEIKHNLEKTINTLICKRCGKRVIVYSGNQAAQFASTAIDGQPRELEERNHLIKIIRNA